ncbi:MAG: DUF2306 domain-containing protein [Actinomycetes bacterium]
MDVEQVAPAAHVGLALAALLIGAWVLGATKGTSRHRALGTGYVVALVALNVAALLVHREATFGVFHVLAVVSLLTVMAGFVPMKIRAKSPPRIARHGYFMAWSYAGLVAAGCGQLAASAVDGGRVTVLTAVAIVLAVSAVVIHWRVPRILASLEQ